MGEVIASIWRIHLVLVVGIEPRFTCEVACLVHIRYSTYTTGMKPLRRIFVMSI